MLRALSSLVVLVVVSVGAGCPIGVVQGEGRGEDAGPSGPDYPLPATDATDRLGGDDTLDIACWNLKNFPCGNGSFDTSCRGDAAATPALVADIVASMDIDLLMVEEIDSESAFTELVDRLRFEGELSTHTYGDGTYQKIGVLYRPSLLSASTPTLLFDGSFDFPRPAFEVPITWHGGGGDRAMTLIGVHFKAGEAAEDFDRRAGAFTALEGYVRTLTGAGDDVVVLGDFNEDLGDSAGRANFVPFLDDARYVVHTEPLAAAGEESYLPSGALIDHIVTSRSLDGALGGGGGQIPRIDLDVENYRGRVSDHLPVVLRFLAPD